MLARRVDLCDQRRQRRALTMRDFLQVTPEGIFKTDAGLVSINDDGMFDNRGFHQGFPTAPRKTLYRDSESRRSNLIPPRYTNAPFRDRQHSEIGLAAVFPQSLRNRKGNRHDD